MRIASLRSTKFVLLHGVWPFVRGAGALLQKPNVFLDFSQQSLGIALTGMMRDGQITLARAVTLATMMMRTSAEQLYRIK